MAGAQDVGLARILKREYLTTLQGGAFTFAYAAPEARAAQALPCWQPSPARACAACLRADGLVRRRCCWAASAPPLLTAMAWVCSPPRMLCLIWELRLQRALCR